MSRKSPDQQSPFLRELLKFVCTEASLSPVPHVQDLNGPGLSGPPVDGKVKLVPVIVLAVQEKTHLLAYIFGLASERAPVRHVPERRYGVNHLVEPVCCAFEAAVGADVGGNRIEVFKGARETSPRKAMLLP